MPEEINRKVTDSITDYFFTTSHFANENLEKEGISKDRIFFVGNVMIDSLLKNKAKFRTPSFWSTLKLETTQYFVLTLHRPSNVDDARGIEKILHLITELSSKYQVVFPIHPRTENRFKNLGFHSRLISIENLTLTPPLDYFSFQKLVSISKALVTDSGGIQEETTFLKIPCITLRENTERPITTTIGSNVLMEFNVEQILSTIENPKKEVAIPELWDGKTAERIIDHILKLA
jgi:UDP-N-acetylglucosamine 2-epimerase (non-hydrolysing)